MQKHERRRLATRLKIAIGLSHSRRARPLARRHSGVAGV